MRIVSFNSSVYDSTNKLITNDLDEDHFGQFEWFENQLIDARNNNAKVWIIQHEPACSGFDAKTNKYLNLIEKYQDVITYEFTGHSHQNEFR